MTYSILRNGQAYGPYALEDLERYISAGNVLPSDTAQDTATGACMPVWQLLQAVPVAPPPMPPAMPAQRMYTQADASAYPLGITGSFPVAGTALYPLFPVSKTKFIVMSLCTLGLYHIFWAYKSWSRIQEQTREPMMPWARALFMGIWNFAYFTRVETRARTSDLVVNWNPVLLGIAVIAFNASNRLPGAWSVVALFSFLPYLPVIDMVERLNAPFAATTEEPPNSRFTAGNIVVIVIGGLVLLLVLLGFVMIASGYGKDAGTP